MVEFSVILPAHNEAENLPDLIAELNSVMTQLQKPFEIIVVDDGSTAATADSPPHSTQACWWQKELS